VSAGVAPNKFLAKVASDWDKPDGLTVIEPSRVKFFLQQLPLSCIPGVGQSTQKKLSALGLSTCSDILSKSEIDLVQYFGKFGQRLYHFSRGDDPRPVTAKEQRKSMSVEHTVDSDIAAEECQGVLTMLHHKLIQRLSQKQPIPPIKKVFVKIKFTDFSRTTIEMCTESLNVSTCETLFQQGWQRYQKTVRLLGVGVRFSDHQVQGGQLDFFEGHQC